MSAYHQLPSISPSTMDAPAEMFIDELAARTDIKDYGNISIVTIPNGSTLSDFERNAVLNRARQQQMTTSVYADSLTSRLGYITPPVDEEAESKESRLLEAQARKELEIEGCPPCYPHDPNVPPQNPPEKCQAIVRYWESFPGTDDVVLCAQLSDWRKFRTSQRRDRARYRNKPFSNFVDEVCERRRRHKLGGHVRLLLELEQQNRLEDWVEFQNFHLKRLERLEKMRGEWRKDLYDAQEKAAKNVEVVRQGLENAECDLELHRVLLWWIEQERREIDSRPPAAFEEEKHDGDTTSKLIGMTSTRDHGTRQVKVPASLGKVRVTKATQIQKPKADLSLQDGIPISLPRHLSPYRARKTPLPGRAQSKRWRASHRLQPASESIMTRSGQISKPPVRWAPE